MGERTEKAIENHKHFHSCSSAVLCAFSSDAGIDEKTAAKEAAPFAGGRMTKCGAVLAAEYVLKKRFGDGAQAYIDEFEREFTDMNRSLNCKELKGSLTGQVLRSCRGCVSDASELLEAMIGE